MLIKFFMVFLLLVTAVKAMEDPLFSRLTLEDPLAYSVTVQNIGQGSCAVIRNYSNNKLLIVDAGSSSTQPMNKKTRLVRLFGFSEENPDVPLQEDSMTVIVSHSDDDHINLFESVFGLNVNLLSRVGLIVLGDHFDNYFRTGSTKEFISNFVLRVPPGEGKIRSLSHDISGIDLKSALTAKPPFRMPCARRLPFTPQTAPLEGFFSPSLTTSSGDLLQVIGANAGAGTGDTLGEKEKDTNANGAVVRLCINGKNILIMGDATGHTTDRILEAGAVAD